MINQPIASEASGLPARVQIPDFNCRFCGRPLQYSVVDLGLSPLCESYVAAEDLNLPETFYPLHPFVCDHCFLVQLDAYVRPEEIFDEYAYFSSYADSWLAHAQQYVDDITARFDLTPDHRVVELASNDGYLLQYFVEKGIPVLGVEPAANVAEVAVAKGVPTRIAYFGKDEAEAMIGEGLAADLVIGNNVLAQVPDLNSFVAGISRLLKPSGVATMEFPHVMRLMMENQFDTIYHEHFGYFSLYSVERIFGAHGLQVFDVEELSTHGGSLRIYARHQVDDGAGITDRISQLRDDERRFGIDRLERYGTFAERVCTTKRKLLSFLIEAKNSGKTVAGYGAPGKGNTLLNFCGIRTDLLAFTVDRNPYKQGKFLPGTRIPIYEPEKIRQMQPDYVLILPWNFKDEIMEQMSDIREWGGQFVVPIPEVRVIS